MLDVFPARQFAHRLLCYHTGFEPGVVEGPFDPGRDAGVDRFIQAYLEHDYRPNEGNVYAELGSCWRHYMGKPEQAANLLGKLLNYLGHTRICWGTDAIWYGSPQDQIQTFRSFSISEEFQVAYGYPPLTAEAKSNILGNNAARLHGLKPNMQTAAADSLDELRQRYYPNRNPSFLTYGPKDRQTFASLFQRWRPGPEG